MKVLFLGGASGVGASCLALELANQWIVVDAGIRMDRTSDPLPDLALLQDKMVSAIFVTHAHADHIGALPLLHRAYPTAPIYASRATGLLMEVMLADALRIMERRAVEEMELPLYPPELVARMLQQVRPLPLGESVKLPGLADITIHASRAGHIAGALSLGLVSPEASVVVSGDLSITPQRTVLGAIPPEVSRPDLLVLESTYGARLHPNRQAEEQRLAQAVASGIARGGHVLIPCFGLGRGQELLLLLQAAQEQGHILPFPIYVDGLIRKVCSAYSLLPEALTPRLARQLRRGYRPFEGPNVTFVREAGERKPILQGPPACILASSGMLSGGPSAWYAARLATDPNASILFSGYLDSESPGRRLLDLAEGKRDTLELEEKQIQVACTVATYSLSAHADGNELASYATQLRPRCVALVHGDQEARQALRMALDRMEVLLPQDGETLDLATSRASYHVQEPPLVPQEALPYGIGDGVLFSAAHLQILWRALLHLPTHQAVTLRELVSVWYGDAAIAEHAIWMEDVLEEEQPYDEPYFVRHPELPEAYQVRKTQQDTREERLGRLVGQVVLLRLQAESAKPALCRAIESHDTVRVLHPRGDYNERTRFSLRIVLDVVGRLPYEDGRSERTALTEVVKTARRLRKTLSAHTLARGCSETQSYTLTELCERAGLPVHDLPTRLAVAKLVQQHPRLFALREPALDGAGAARYGLAPTYQTALLEPEVRERPDQTWIRSVVERHLGSPADLARLSVHGETGDVTLVFFFPEVAEERYRAAIDAAAEEAGVSVTIAPQTHQGALAQAAQRHLPTSLLPEGHPSVFIDRRTVRLICMGEASGEQIAEAQARFYQETRWHLEVVQHTKALPSVVSKVEPKIQVPAVVSYHLPPPAKTSPAWPLPQQEALELARARLSSLAGYQKVGVDQAQQALRVRFDFPDVATSRYAEVLARVEAETGWRVSLHPTPRQEDLVSLAQRLLPASLTVAQTPSIYWGEHTIGLQCHGTADEQAIEEAQQHFREQTGWRLEIGLLAQAEASRLSQAEAVARAGALLSATEGLCQVGVDAKRGVLWLRYQFPDVVQERYAQVFAQLTEQSGWRVEIQKRPDQKALVETALRLLPDGLQVTGKVSVYQERHVVSLLCTGSASEERRSQAQHQFARETGWSLEVQVPDEPARVSHPAGPVRSGLMPEAEAVTLVRATLRETKPRIAVDTVRSILQVTLPFPDAAQLRYGDQLAELQERTGWQVQIAPTVDGEALRAEVRSLLSARNAQIGTISLVLEEKRVEAQIRGTLKLSALSAAQEVFQEKTGWELVVQSA